MKLALTAMLPLLLLMPAEAAAQRARTAKPPATTTATITVTDQSGAPLSDVRVNLVGALDRSGSTGTDGTIKFDGLRQGTYRLRFQRDGFVLFERELEIRAGQPAPNISVALTPAPEAPPSPDPEPAAPEIPPAGPALTVDLPGYIERNFIGGGEPQKLSPIGCSGYAETMLWQVRDPWTGREHAAQDALLYVVGGEGTARLGQKDVPLQAGTFVQVPRGTTYALTRRGRNPLIVLATLVGEPCQ